MSTKSRVLHVLFVFVLTALPTLASAHERGGGHRAHQHTPRTYRPSGEEARCHEAERSTPRTYRPQRFAPAGDRRVYRPRSGHTYRPSGNESYRPRSR